MKINKKKILVAVLVLAFILRVFFAVFIPIFEKPDEQYHFEYIKFVAENKKLPVGGNFFSEFFQPPLYYVAASFILSLIRVFTNDIWSQVILMRLISVLLTMITLYLVYRIALLIFNDFNLAVSALIFAALLPSYINVSSNTTNANLSQVFTAMIIYLLLISLKKQESTKRNVLIGIFAGLALITRQSEIAAVLAIPFAFCIKCFPDLKKALKQIALIAFIALLISGWFLGRNLALYGDILAYNAIKMSTPPDNLPKDFVFFGRLLGWTFVTFWVTFGRTNNIFVGNPLSSNGIVPFFLFYFILLVVSLCSAAGLYNFFKRCRNKSVSLSRFQKKSLVVLVVHILLLLFSFVSFNLYNLEPQGRLLFPAISGIAVFFTFGIYSLWPGRNKGKFLIAYLASFLIIDAISIISVYLFYR